MNILALIGALTLTYYRPLAKQDWLSVFFAPYTRLLERNLNGGKYPHGVIAWVLAVLLPAVLIALAYFVLLEINSFLGISFGIVILYLTLRFSQFGQRAEQIATALRDYNIDQARSLLTQWEGAESNHYNAEHYNVSQIASISIETTFRHAHHGLFAPIFWFALLGPGGALLYRLSHLLKLEWEDHTENQFHHFALQVFSWLDWLPTRITAGAFAIVGDFEDAAYCWRTQAASWPDKALGIILASGAGALGVKLCESLPHRGVIEFRQELGLGDEADADYLQSAVGLVWRVLALMVGLLLLLTFTHWLGN
jgi:adenosylcobinamide-phosphate synthase